VLRNFADNDTTADVMQFRVGREERDDSRIPTRLADFERLDPRQVVRTRTFTFTNGTHTARAAGWSTGSHSIRSGWRLSPRMSSK
jgi:hypothetical protein